MNKKEKTNLDVVIKVATDIQRLGYTEYLMLVSHALMQLLESACDMNKREESERWESRSVSIEKLIAKDIIKFH